MRIEIHRNGGVTDRQILDVDVADLFAHDVYDAIALDETAAGDGDVEQLEYIVAGHRQHPVTKGVEFPGSIDAANQGTHRAAGN